MTDEPKSIFRIAGIACGRPRSGLGALLISPSRGLAIAAAGSAVMAIGFVIWTQRLVAEQNHLRLRDAALRNEMSALEEKVQTATRGAAPRDSDQRRGHGAR